VNILIVEDEFVSIKYLKEMISEVDFLEIDNIYKARDGQTAYEIIEQDKVELVFMDINIQGPIDGIECARKIYALDKSIPIIFTTAYKDS
jgi:two-component SAPR family response regulator